jgi:glucose-6-phosphate dehydrogenase assembly protein OpcA
MSSWNATVDSGAACEARVIADHGHGTVNATRRLSGRADSIAGVDAALARIWAELTRQGMDERETTGRSGTLARTRVLTLVVVASRPETAERAMDAIFKLAGRHPSRSVVLGFGDPDGPPHLDARVQAHCHPFGGSSEVCTEQITVNLSGEACQHPGAIATPLLLHDLPVAMWWTDDPPIGGRSFMELMDVTDRLVIDSGLFRDDGRERLVALARQPREHLEIHDIGWMRLDLWRTLFAGLFDDPATTPFVRSLQRVRIAVSQPGTTVRISRAALYLGWLASRLGWRVETPLEDTGDGFVGRVTQRGRPVELAIVPEHVERDPQYRAPGGLVRVEAEAQRGSQRATMTVERRAQHLRAECRVGGDVWATRAGTLERFEDAPYLAAALEASGEDEGFTAALPVAASLVAGGA